MLHIIETEILQELINKVKTLPFEQVADLLNKVVTSAKPATLNENTQEQVEQALTDATPVFEGE